MECLSSTLASTSWFDRSCIKFYPVSMIRSSLISPHPHSAFAVPFREAPTLKRIQQAPPPAATIGAATVTAETTLDPSTRVRKVQFLCLVVVYTQLRAVSCRPGKRVIRFWFGSVPFVRVYIVSL